MAFPLGKPILAMLLVALLSGGYIALEREPARKPITLWVFADAHYRTYKPLIDQYNATHALQVDMRVVQSRAMVLRLQSIFSNGLSGEDVPDVCEIEVGTIGTFFRPPVDQVGFEPVKPLLEASGYFDKIVASRYAPWTKQGVIFGVPHDVHPCCITYRDDLFREAGIDLSQRKTWPAFHQACLDFQAYWRARGFATRHAMELPESRPDMLMLMLLQRGINLVDDYDRVHLADPKVAQTVAFYARCIAGAGRVGAESIGGDGPFTRDIEQGDLCAIITPDWRVTYIKQFAPDLAGKWRVMPMPVFDSTDAPTSTWGGTMAGIPRAAAHRQEAWDLIQLLYFSPQGIRAREQATNILPPITTVWAEPFYHQPDPYYGGQKVNELLIDLARQIPRRYMTPAAILSSMHLNFVLSRAKQYIESGGDDAGLEAYCQRWLDEASVDLRKRIEQSRF